MKVSCEKLLTRMPMNDVKLGLDDWRVPMKVDLPKIMVFTPKKPGKDRVALQAQIDEKCAPTLRQAAWAVFGDWKAPVEKVAEWVNYTGVFKTAEFLSTKGTRVTYVIRAKPRCPATMFEPRRVPVSPSLEGL